MVINDLQIITIIERKIGGNAGRDGPKIIPFIKQVVEYIGKQFTKKQLLKAEEWKTTEFSPPILGFKKMMTRNLLLEQHQLVTIKISFLEGKRAQTHMTTSLTLEANSSTLSHRINKMTNTGVLYKMNRFLIVII